MGDREKRQRSKKQPLFRPGSSKVQHVNSEFWQQKFVIKLLGGMGREGRTDDVTKEQQCSTNILDRKNCSKAIAHHLFDLKIFKINVCRSIYKR